MYSPVTKKAQPLRGARNQKAAHIKGQKQMADCVGKPPDHGGRVSSKQILDIYGRKHT